MLVMDLGAYHRLRTAIQGNAAPADQSDVTTVETRLREVLTVGGLFVDVQVQRTDDPDHLVVALCRFDARVPVERVAAQLERIWAEGVGYPFWTRYGMRLVPGRVELEGVSRESPDRGYVTVRVVAYCPARVPAQRVPSDHPTPARSRPLLRLVGAQDDGQSNRARGIAKT